MARKKTKVRIVLQGRKFTGYRTAQDVGDGLFSYNSYIYDVDDFPASTTINLDKTGVNPVGYLPPYKKQKVAKNKKKKASTYNHSFNAVLYSNARDCPDVQEISHTC